MEQIHSLPISKRSGIGFATMLLIAKMMESESERAALAMILITCIFVVYAIADEIKDRRRNATKKEDS